MTAQHPAIDVATIDRALDRKSLRLRFDAPLERLFEMESGAERARELVLRGGAGLVLYVAYLVLDYRLTPDTFWLAVVLRLGVVAPLAVILMLMGWFNRLPVLRESVAGTLVVAAVISTLAVMLLSDSSVRESHADSIVLTVLFLTLLQRLRFTYAAVSSLVIYALYSWALLSMPDYAPDRHVPDIVIFGGAVVLALIGSWHGEHHMRRFYLLHLRGRLMNATLEDMSQHDPLTGLQNRRALDRALLEIAAHASDGEDIAIALLDIDHFKPYNDGLGHMAGDTCLKRVAAVVIAELRGATDTAFRFGGEEFLILFRRTDLPAACAVAERMRRALESAAIPHPMRGVVTGSFGLASARVGSAVSSDELIQAADAALYAAKRNGRNQVWPPFLHKSGEVVDLADRMQAR